MHVWLFDRELQKAVEAELAPLAECHIAQANATWVPEFHRRRGAAERDEDSLLWKTGAKYVDLLAQHDAGQAFVITTPGELQGLLILQAATEPSRLESGAQVIRVRYLATAPWNRPGQESTGRFRRVGTLLLARAIWVSIAAGCLGRLGLHSLAGSDGFYRKLGFCDVGPDPAHRGLRYFELSKLQAARLLNDLALLDSACELVFAPKTCK